MKLIIGRDCLGDDYQPFNARNFKTFNDLTVKLHRNRTNGRL